jgi:hypothetical protein
MEFAFKIIRYEATYGYSHLNDTQRNTTTIEFHGTVENSSFVREVPEMEGMNYSDEVDGEFKTLLCDDFYYDDMKAKYSNAIGYLPIAPSASMREKFCPGASTFGFSVHLQAGSDQIKPCLT